MYLLGVVCEHLSHSSGPKAIKRFVKLMTKRIDWFASNTNEDDDDDDEQEEDDQSANKCELVWQVISEPTPHKKKTNIHIFVFHSTYVTCCHSYRVLW